MPLVPQRPLGSQGLVVSAQGLGCMGMTAFYGNFDRAAQEAESLRTISKALELGVNFLDTAWIYQSFGAGGGGNFTNEEVVAKAIKQHGREKFVIATKFGILPTANGLTVSGSEAIIRSQLADSLDRLGVDCIDLYYMHRMDPSTPIEDTMRVLKSLVDEGNIKYIGLSECTPSELRRAHAVHPITAIQMEWSLQSRDLEAQVVPTARELGVGIVAYSPLCRGFLTAIDTFDKLEDNDWRRTLPRYSGDNLVESKAKVAKFFDLAAAKECTPAQLALAWVHAQGHDVFPIPGTKSSTRIIENAHAVEISLTSEEVASIAAAAESVEGPRYAGKDNSFNARMDKV
ncbi:hypothetical protein H310_10907 [Aphanomyces invadans]|uniref:NADP-dependent oxidoreductase domain-containing protein n=1 Tax=Aphanomyces invadans TaxID=157072 RepID=A0A024TPD4_9STRA|nr:hypothetical protein H310_10907 [Aphanomyces invadans]ETV95868.1 hypothetical protein H310_10907 [Aphanomyces invadans]|eukprot:XP_008875619.1 hypothetical protein H310_10907 [Aphanomyces invadans]